MNVIIEYNIEYNNDYLIVNEYNNDNIMITTMIV